MTTNPTVPTEEQLRESEVEVNKNLGWVPYLRRDQIAQHWIKPQADVFQLAVRLQAILTAALAEIERLKAEITLCDGIGYMLGEAQAELAATRKQWRESDERNVTLGKQASATIFNLETELTRKEERVVVLEEIIVHCYVHSGYRNCGYNKMTTQQQKLFDDVCAEKTPFNPLDHEQSK